jgi:hypothetical protein
VKGNDGQTALVGRRQMQPSQVLYEGTVVLRYIRAQFVPQGHEDEPQAEPCTEAGQMMSSWATSSEARRKRKKARTQHASVYSRAAP